jgi:hypothetical protein
MDCNRFRGHYEGHESFKLSVSLTVPYKIHSVDICTCIVIWLGRPLWIGTPDPNLACQVSQFKLLVTKGLALVIIKFAALPDHISNTDSTGAEDRKLRFFEDYLTTHTVDARSDLGMILSRKIELHALPLKLLRSQSKRQEPNACQY